MASLKTCHYTMKKMKSDKILSSIVNFLLPIIFLYALFFLVDFFDSGFFVFIYSLLLVIIAISIFYTFYFDQKIFTKINFDNLVLFLILSCISYIFSLLIFITDGFSL